MKGKLVFLRQGKGHLSYVRRCNKKFEMKVQDCFQVERQQFWEVVKDKKAYAYKKTKVAVEVVTKNTSAM